MKHPRRLTLVSVVLLISIGLGLIFGPTLWARLFSTPSSNADSMHPAARAPVSLISIPRAHGLFDPFLLTIGLNTTVTWHNQDRTMHVVTTTAQQSSFLNPQTFSFRLPAGGQSLVTFHHAGLYHYYDTTMSQWNARLSRVEASPGTPHYPLAMDGVIWVQGPIEHLSASTINTIPSGHDTFSQEFLAITQPGGVSWHNGDVDPHFIGLVPDWSPPINPTDIGLFRVAGTRDVLGGATTIVFFTKPGLYYYYCRNHDQVDLLTHRARALPMNSEYPVPMEGFVLVVNNQAP